jgi:hypothetical protein
MFAGLAPLLRSEGFASIAVCWRSVLIAWRDVCPWFASSSWSFGMPVSHSVGVKAARSSVGWWARPPDAVDRIR